MNESYDDWKKNARIGRCDNCRSEVPVREFSYQGFGDITSYCYLCASAARLPDNSVSLISAMSLLLHNLKPPKKPSKPKGPKAPKVPGMTIPVMTVTRRK